MQFTATPEGIIAAAASCDSTNAEIQQEISQMQQYVAGLIGSYTGTAASMLESLSQQWGQDAITLNNVLTEIASNLRSNADNYTTNETTNTNNYSNLLSNLPPARF